MSDMLGKGNNMAYIGDGNEPDDMAADAVETNIDAIGLNQSENQGSELGQFDVNTTTTEAKTLAEEPMGFPDGVGGNVNEPMSDDSDDDKNIANPGDGNPDSSQTSFVEESTNRGKGHYGDTSASSLDATSEQEHLEDSQNTANYDYAADNSGPGYFVGGQGSGPYIRVLRDMPGQPMWEPSPQPTGLSGMTILLSLLPLFLGVVALIVGVWFPIPLLPSMGGADPRSLAALVLAVLGGLLIVVAGVWGLASAIRSHRVGPTSR